ncbi:MAG: tetratricopeptide repeat protein [Devosiaceae bacterium]
MLWRALLALVLLAAPAYAQTAEPQASAEPSAQEAPEQDPFTLDPAVAFEAFFAGNYARAFDLAVTFAGRGDGPSMRLLGQMYSAGLGVEQSQEEALEWYRLATETNDIEAKVLLATAIMDGPIPERDEEHVAQLLREASDAGNSMGTQMLGMLHLEGRGVERDIDLGAQLMRQAADAGDVTAQYTLGILYQEGAGVRQDTAQAYAWFEQAARRGNTEAQIEFALGLLNGSAGENDLSQERRVEDAIFWLRRAAEGGNPIAENRLAHAYSQGFGVQLDPVQAAYYHARAVAGGLADARLDAFVGSLPEDQRREAQERIAQDRAPANPFNQ